MRVLFVCSANKCRSKTAEDHFSEKFPEIEFDSAGTNLKVCRKEGTNPLSEESLMWADVIYCMERKHADLIGRHTKEKVSGKIIVLGIPDRFKYGEPELIEILERKTDFK